MHPDSHLHLRLHRERTDRAGRPGRIHALRVPRDPLLQRLRRQATRFARARGEAAPTTVVPAPAPTHAVGHTERARDVVAS